MDAAELRLKSVCGVVVPIPTLPTESINIVDVACATPASLPTRKLPLVRESEVRRVDVETHAGTPLPPAISMFPPVPAAVTWRASLALPYKMPFVAKVFAPVPPYATERVDEAETAPPVACRGPVREASVNCPEMC